MKAVGLGVTSKLGALLLIHSFAACGGGDTRVDARAPTPVFPPPSTTPPIAGEAAPLVPDRIPITGAAGSAPIEPPPTSLEPASVSMWCDVQRTLDSRCTACHNEQKAAGAPMSLKTYADLQAPAYSDRTKKVFQVVGVRVHDTLKPMPPQEKLTAAQLSGIDAWVAAGAPAGADPTCAGGVPTPQVEDTWPEHCDAVYKILAAADGRKNTVAARSESHPQIAVRAPWGRERVQAIAWRAITDNTKVLHHWILYGPSREFLFGWAPGKDQNEPLPPDVGVFLPSSNMTLDVHYNNASGTQAEQDASGVEICVLKEANFRPKTATVTNRLQSSLISIPPHAVDHEITGTCTHSGMPVRLLSASPHAHRTAHHMKFTVVKANGMTISMHDDKFNFEEQTTYAMRPPVVIEAGDRIVTTCTFTNDTDRVITFGENTGNEMCFNFALYEPMGGLNCGLGGFR
jgi:Copper type II ascorbate-dependent monooxygenase, C-terminal domain